MSVSQTRYVDITSGVGAANAVPERQLIGRMFTTNALIAPQTFKEFSSLDDVGAYFGTGSDEYLRGGFYFDFVSKNITAAPLLSFGRWVETAQAGVIYGAQQLYAIATFTAVTAGSLDLTIGSTAAATITGINLSSAANLAAVATDVQTAIRAHTAGGVDWTSATVAYDATNSRFILTGGVAGPEAMAITAAGSGTDLGPLLGWLDARAVVGQGSAVETITDCLTASEGMSNNFGSFLFMPSLTQSQTVEAATWNDSKNVMYMFMVPVTAATAANMSAALADLAGCAMTLSPLSNEYPEQVPMTVLGATNYNNVNSVQNYEFQNGFPLTPSVLTDLDADTYDALNVNYYVQTQNAGAKQVFYSQGVLTGTATDPVDQNVYANEQWFKQACAAALMTLLLDQPIVSANTQGIAQVSAILQSEIQQALINGTISVGKPETENQKLYIATVTGQQNAWIQVVNAGYWLGVVVQTFVVDNTTKYKIVYTLVYSKDDAVRFIQGSDILI